MLGKPFTLFLKGSSSCSDYLVNDGSYPIAFDPLPPFVSGSTPFRRADMSSSTEHNRPAEHRRRKVNWKQRGPYLSERACGTVREDYSPDGSAWEFFSHDHARSRAFRWEEDVKEYYFYLDATPTHSYMRMLDKYPQSEYPYRDLVDENRKRGVFDFEHEHLNTGIFDHRCYFDITVEYAKPGESRAFRLRFASTPIEHPFGSFDAVFGDRRNEADQFCSAIQRRDIRQEKRIIQRQALVGMLSSKQFCCVTIE
jgi:hypothetical protein